MDKENKNDSSVRVQFALSLSVLIVVPIVFVIIRAWTMPTKNEEHKNSQRSISSIYSSFVHQPERKVKE